MGAHGVPRDDDDDAREASTRFDVPVASEGACNILSGNRRGIASTAGTLRVPDVHGVFLEEPHGRQTGPQVGTPVPDGGRDRSTPAGGQHLVLAPSGRE